MRLDGNQQEDRNFSVQKTKGKGTKRFETVVAEECILHESGALVFRTRGFLVKAIGPGKWVSLEDAEDE